MQTLHEFSGGEDGVGLNSDELKDSPRFALIQVNSSLRPTLHLNFQPNPLSEFSRLGIGLNSDELLDSPRSIKF